MVKHQKRSAKSAKKASTKYKKSHKGKRAGASKRRQPKKTTRKGARKTGTKSNYNLYIQHTISQLKAADSNMTHQEAFKKAAHQWRTAAENPKNQQN